MSPFNGVDPFYRSSRRQVPQGMPALFFAEISDGLIGRDPHYVGCNAQRPILSTPKLQNYDYEAAAQMLQFVSPKSLILNPFFGARP